MAELEARQLRDLTFSELSRSLRALSSTYVERRTKLVSGGALNGAGKRAAFALFYGPLHFQLVHHVVTELGSKYTNIRSLLDLGCGTAASSAGWAIACAGRPRVTGVDRHPWAVDEARLTFSDLRLAGTFRVGDLADMSGTGPGSRDTLRRPTAAGAVRPRRDGDAILLAYTVNELVDAHAREALKTWLLHRARTGGRILIVEPLAGFVAPWWSEWQRAFEAVGGQSREWRVRLPLPPIVEKLDRAAGLNHRELKARTIEV
jgi:predicted RNA methylase